MQFWYQVQKAIQGSDIVAEALDARLPELSRSADIEQLALRFNKPLIFIVNKCDLISKERRFEIQKYLGKQAVCVSGKKNLGMRKLKEALIIAGKKHNQNIKSPVVCVVGYPNVGKSSIINALAKRARAHVSPNAGTTRGIQWIKVGSVLRVIDSPGVMPIEENDEARIALLSARDPEKLKRPELAAINIIRFLEKNYPKLLMKHYNLNLEETSDESDVLTAIARHKHLILKGNEPDIRRASIQLIRDWQRGTISLA